MPVRQHPRSHRLAAHVPQVLLVLLVALLAACGGSPSGGTRTNGSTNGCTGAAAPAHAPKPVLDEDFPDPDVMKAGDTYYAYATQRTGPFGNLQLATSKDLATWQLSSTDPLPKLPSWATAGRTWAPDVSAVPGGYVM